MENGRQTTVRWSKTAIFSSVSLIESFRDKTQYIINTTSICKSSIII